MIAIFHENLMPYFLTGYESINGNQRIKWIFYLIFQNYLLSWRGSTFCESRVQMPVISFLPNLWAVDLCLCVISALISKSLTISQSSTAEGGGVKSDGFSSLVSREHGQISPQRLKRSSFRDATVEGEADYWAARGWHMNTPESSPDQDASFYEDDHWAPRFVGKDSIWRQPTEPSTPRERPTFNWLNRMRDRHTSPPRPRDGRTRGRNIYTDDYWAPMFSGRGGGKKYEREKKSDNTQKSDSKRRDPPPLKHYPPKDPKNPPPLSYHPSKSKGRAYYSSKCWIADKRTGRLRQGLCVKEGFDYGDGWDDTPTDPFGLYGYEYEPTDHSGGRGLFLEAFRSIRRANLPKRLSKGSRLIRKPAFRRRRTWL